MDQYKADKVSFEKFKNLFEGMRDARKLFRLFKSVNEIQKIKQMLLKPQFDNEIDFLLNLLARLGFLGYWFFDNLQILAKLKLMKRPASQFLKPAMFFWWLGIVFTLIFSLKKLRKLNKELFAVQAIILREPEKAKDLEGKQKTLMSSIQDCYRQIAKCLGDFLPSGSGWGLFQLLGINVSDSIIGVGGFISGAIACYEAYPKN